MTSFQTLRLNELRTFTRIALRVKNEIEEELHRQEATEDPDERDEDIHYNDIASVGHCRVA